MVATVSNLSYRVLRCAQAGGAEVYVLGNPGASWLRFSCYCRRFVYSASIIHGGRDEALALEINCLAHELGISVIIPGDAPSTRALIACRDLIEAPCFPLPSLEQFDLLNNKWSFAQLCEELGIRYPATRLLPNATTLAQEILAGQLEYPLVAKPLSRSGGGGVVFLDGVDSEKRLNTINYQPVLVQKMILGQDIGSSVFARAGKIDAFVAHSLRRRVYATFRHDQIQSDIAKIVARLQLEGVYNFDMILRSDGSIYYLECNPRFYFKINLSMLAGINFVKWGFPGAKAASPPSIPDGVRVRFPEALLTSLDFRSAKQDLVMTAYIISDPAPYLIEKLKLMV
jgi:ATP-grasp domain